MNSEELLKELVENFGESILTEEVNTETPLYYTRNFISPTGENIELNFWV